MQMLQSATETQLAYQALVQLAERSECDMRCCLNTLQFLARAGRRIRPADVTGLNIGLKDMTKGAFAVWNQLLSTRVRSLAPQPIARSHQIVLLYTE